MSHMQKKFQDCIRKEKEKYSKYLDKAGLKLTSGRQIVFDEVMQAHGHFAPEELIEQCRQNRRKVSRATIYRSLRELLEAGVIRETAFGEKHQHFEHIYDEEPHHHARCIRCLEVVEFPCLNGHLKYEKLLKKQNFNVLGHEMHFYGICEGCQ